MNSLTQYNILEVPLSVCVLVVHLFLLLVNIFVRIYHFVYLVPYDATVFFSFQEL